MSTLSVFAAAPSKVPFYVAGGVLVLWAIILAAIGITRAGFPGSKGARGGVLAVSAVLAAVAMGTAVATAGEEGEGEAAATTNQFDLVADPGGASTYNRPSGLVKPGAVSVHLTNESSQDHNVAIADGGKVLAASKIISRGETEIEVDLEPGEYAFFCQVDSHRQSGMEGTLTVR